MKENRAYSNINLIIGQTYVLKLPLYCVYMIKLTQDSYKVKGQLTEWHHHLGQSKQSLAFIGPLGGTVSWVNLEAKTKFWD